jgi:hypothetical protein
MGTRVGESLIHALVVTGLLLGCAGSSAPKAAERAHDYLPVQEEVDGKPARLFLVSFYDRESPPSFAYEERR